MQNLAVVGLGYWGPNLVRNSLNLKDAHLLAVCDQSPDRLAKIKPQLPAEVNLFTDIESILTNPNIDGVLIATPIQTHYPIAKSCLEAGKHIFVEKPFTADEEQALELLSLADKNQRKICVGHTFLYNGAVREMKNLIDQGEIGDVLHIESRRLNLGLFQNHNNVIWDLMPHDISIVSYLLNNQQPEKVTAVCHSHYPSRVEDTAIAALTFQSGVSAYLNVSWIDPCKVREVKVVGTKKMLLFDDIPPSEKLRVYDQGAEQKYDSFAGFQTAYRYGDITIPRLNLREPLNEELSDFVKGMEIGSPILSDGLMGYNVVKVLKLIELASKNKN